MTVPLDSSNVQQTFHDHSSSARENSDHVMGIDPNWESKTAKSMGRNDHGMILSAPHINHGSVDELTLQPYIFERDDKRIDVAAPLQPPNDLLIERAIFPQADHIHRNIVDQQMLTVMREQQSRFPKALQLELAKNRGTADVDELNRNYNNDMAQSLFWPESQQKQQQQLHRSVLSQHHLNLGAFCEQQQQMYPNQSYQVPKAEGPSIEPQQSSITLDAVLLSQLSPLELANIQSALLANQLAPSIYNSSRTTSRLTVPSYAFTQLPNFDLNGGNYDNITSVDMLRDLQQAHLRNNDTIIDAIHKSDSDADSNEDQKPPGRR